MRPLETDVKINLENAFFSEAPKNVPTRATALILDI
jgi:hypothetical protein